MFILKLLILFLVLGIIILVHEFGHFICAKKSGVFIYEFSIGMGPLIHSHKGKDGIDYNIRAIPIGGYVSMAGEVYDDDDKIPKKKLMCNKPWYTRLMILVAGVFNNFVLAIVVLIIYALIWGASTVNPVIEKVADDSAASKYGLEAGDEILKINDYKIATWDRAQIILYYKNKTNTYSFEVKSKDGEVKTIEVVPDVVEDEDGNKSNVFGIQMKTTTEKGFIASIKYGFTKSYAIMDSMTYTIWGLVSGKVSISNLSGPVGIYSVVGESLNYNFSYAIRYILYILALLSINVGYINILPFPAFDGGHVLFLIIEKIKGSKVNEKFENTCHLIGFALIFLLMIIVTISDILKLF